MGELLILGLVILVVIAGAAFLWTALQTWRYIRRDRADDDEC